MQGRYFYRWLVAVATLSAWAMQAQAAELDLTSPAQAYVQASKPFMLAANENDVILQKKKNADAPAIKAQQDYEPPLLSGSNVHKYLGLGTVALAGLAMVTASEGCEHNCVAQERDRNGTHAQVAKAAGVMAVATVMSGLISHWDDFSLEDGWTDPDNLHVLLGATGAALMAYAVNKSATTGGTSQVSHAGMAELGALGMLVAIKLTW